jgi:hypothetical protein
MNNFSLFTADRATHLKIVAVAIICATLVAGLGVSASISDDSASTGSRIEATVIKAGKSVTASAGNDHVIR